MITFFYHNQILKQIFKQLVFVTFFFKLSLIKSNKLKKLYLKLTHNGKIISINY